MNTSDCTEETMLEVTANAEVGTTEDIMLYGPDARLDDETRLYSELVEIDFGSDTIVDWRVIIGERLMMAEEMEG